MNNPIFVCADQSPFGPTEKLISMVAGLGFSGIEWHENSALEEWSSPEASEKIRADMRKRELLNQYHGPFQDSFDLGQVDGVMRTSDSVALVLAHVLDRADRLDARVVTTHLGTCAPGADRAEAMCNIAEGIRQIVPQLEGRRIRLALENHTGVFLDSPLGDCPEDFDWLFSNIQSEWVGQNIDIGHAHIQGQIEEFLSRPLDRLMNVHMHDNDRSSDQHLPMGKGTVEWKDVLKRLSASCYSGPLTFEFFDDVDGAPFEVAEINFSEMDRALDQHANGKADAILLDLGFSSPQVDKGERGFSYRIDGPLDMRMTPDEGPTAAEWLESATEKEIADVIYQHGDERHSRRIARAIVRVRESAPIRTTCELAEIIRRAMPRTKKRRRHHPARRSFQAIRIHINREMEHLAMFLKKLPDMLNPNGRCVIISYHSHEDRPVKVSFLEGAQNKLYERLTRKPLTPSDEEVETNPRSRSAKVRAIRRLGEDDER